MWNSFKYEDREQLAHAQNMKNCHSEFIIKQKVQYLLFQQQQQQ